MNNGFAVSVLTRSHLRAEGYDSRRIKRALDAEQLTLLRRGAYARTSELQNLTAEEQAAVRARAYKAVAVQEPVFGYQTAAALHGLPLLQDDGLTHVISADARPGSGSRVVRHRGPVEDDDIVAVDGLLCTSLVRTVADLARTASTEAALSAADAALRSVAFRPPGSYDRDAAESLRTSALTAIGVNSPGRVRARNVLDFADGRAQLPGESISRLRLRQLGFAPPSLQVPIRGPGGRIYWVDFGLDDVDAWGEFDGMTKYRQLARAEGHSASAVVESEKRREDWIRGVTNRPLVRWGWSDVRDAATLGRRLNAFGIRPPR